jgi:hypothetical protein
MSGTVPVGEVSRMEKRPFSLSPLQTSALEGSSGLMRKASAGARLRVYLGLFAGCAASRVGAEGSQYSERGFSPCF